LVQGILLECGARSVRSASSPADRARLWQGRKKAFGAMGRVSSHLVVQDAVVPRTKLPEVLDRIRDIAARHAVQVCNVFHAGDGNLHPNIPYNADDADESARVHAAMREVMLACIAAGGTITGEHGVGLDKLAYMDQLFSADSLGVMCDLRQVFDPRRLCNPAKVVPVHACREWHGAGAWRSSTEPRPGSTGSHAPAAQAKWTHEVLPPVRELAEHVASATRDGRPLRIHGRGTWLDAGRPVGDASILSTEHLSGIREYVPGDLTLTAGAGTPLETIRRATAEHGQWFACDPLGSHAGTLGATVATGSYGPLATRFGTPRDLLLGVEFVTGEGTVARAGGRVVKNVAGYDLTRLMIGAWGTLGVITEVSVRLHARPEVDRTLAVTLDPDGTALGPACALMDGAPWTPLAFEVLNAPPAERLGLAPYMAALFRLGGNADAVRAQAAAVAQLGDPVEMPSDVWSGFGTIANDLDASLRVAGTRSRFVAIWTDLERLVPAGALLIGNRSRGVIRCMIPGTRALNNAQGQTSDHGIARIAAAVRAIPHATVTCEQLPPHAWPDVNGGPADAELVHALRQRFDPTGILNPGILI
jgi:FAD/FMN-containing dehydrogenase